MDKFQKFIKHNQGRTMYVVTIFPSGNEILKIDKGDKLDFKYDTSSVSFIVNRTKKWGTNTKYIVDVIVSMTNASIINF